MDLCKSLLERMASISPGVRIHLGGEQWQLQIDADEISPRELVVQCASVLIDESYELGIEFFCAREDLCANFYDLDKVLLLFEVIYPTPLYRSITEDAGFKRWLVATVRDAAGDPDYTTIGNLLHYLIEDHPTAKDVFYDTYTFLHDKMRSTPVFDKYVMSMLEADNTTFEAPVDIDVVTQYLNHIRSNVSRLLRAIDLLHRTFPALSDTIQTQYNRLDIYKTNAIDANTLANNTWVYQTHQNPISPVTPLEQALSVRFIREFESITPFYEDYYRLYGQQLIRSDVVSLILGCFERTTIKEVFTASVEAVFLRLAGILPPTDAGLHVFIQTVTLSLVKEFCP